MNNTFRIGSRFQKIKYLCAVANSLVVFVFYFIYRWLLQDMFPTLVDLPLALLFLFIGLVIVRVTLWAADRYANSIVYHVTDAGLMVVRNGMEKMIPWSDFCGVRLCSAAFSGPFPVEFRVGKEVMVLNQYVDGLYALTEQIFQHIRDYVTISPELEKRAKDMRGVY